MPNTKLFLIVLYQIGIWEFKKEKKKKNRQKRLGRGKRQNN